MVLTCMEDKYWIYWTTDVKDGVAGQKEKRKTTEQMNVVKKDMQKICETEKDAGDKES